MDILALDAIDDSARTLVGGKGAALSALTRITGLHIPAGFCVTTSVFQRVVAATTALHPLLEELAQLASTDHEAVAALSARIRRTIEAAPIPAQTIEAITAHLSQFAPDQAWAIRSSATSEDGPHASFAGQQDSYLNCIGLQSVLQHISQCWASLFTERAIVYRLQQGLDQRQATMAVVVQTMVAPQAAGMLFTADPLSGNRRVSSIAASFGLGEALAAGLVNADTYTVRDAQITHQIGVKTVALHAVSTGGIAAQPLAPDQQQRQVLSDAQILELAQLGRRIERHFGAPQDIEWCLADGTFAIVQSRPITTLYPIPEAADEAYHAYVSVGHQQMMTDPLKPLGLAFFLLITAAPMRTAGGRLFVDISQLLATPAGRARLLNTLGHSDPLFKDALATLIARQIAADNTDVAPPEAPAASAAPTAPPYLDGDPAVIAELIASSQAELATLKATIQTKAGPALFDYILEDIQRLKHYMSDPRSVAIIMAAINASAWLNSTMQEWLGSINAADRLSQSVDNNITSEMGLALLDVADTLRPYPELIAYLRQASGTDVLDHLARFPGGQEFQQALETFLERYGMRGIGEIDITRPRWSENPAALIPLILSNLNTAEPQASARRFAAGRQQALQAEEELLARLRELPDGAAKAHQTKQMIDQLRACLGYREYPKYVIISRFFSYKQALMREAEELARAGIIRTPEDIYYLSFDELRAAVTTREVDLQQIQQRQEDYAHFARLTPPRVLTSEGEIITGAYQRDHLPPNALPGLAVSSGVIEGRARVLRSLEYARLEPGDILVTVYTDPSWTPLFVAIAGLVTEVGGIMTHGSVIAREYGLPAVVGVEQATQRIRDGQRIRVHGSAGYVELL